MESTIGLCHLLSSAPSPTSTYCVTSYLAPLFNLGRLLFSHLHTCAIQTQMDPTLLIFAVDQRVRRINFPLKGRNSY